MQLSYDADGNRVSKTVMSGGAFPTTTKVIDVYQAGRIAYETDGANTTLATFTYSPNGTPTSVTVGSNPSTDPRYYYVYNPHGDVVALTNATGTTVATYSYDTFGTRRSWRASATGGYIVFASHRGDEKAPKVAPWWERGFGAVLSVSVAGMRGLGISCGPR